MNNIEEWIDYKVKMCNCFNPDFEYFNSKGLTDGYPIIFYCGDINIVKLSNSVILTLNELHHLIKSQNICDVKIICKTDTLLEKSTIYLCRQQIVSGNVLIISTNNSLK